MRMVERTGVNGARALAVVRFVSFANTAREQNVHARFIARSQSTHRMAALRFGGANTPAH
jgi:hypothetical protein